MKIIDEAKINVTHIYLAQLHKYGYVDYVLTVNFDNLMLRALSLYNIFPATYDMVILKDLTTTTFKEKSVVFLHGQHHGLWLLNTPEEMEKVKDTVPRIFEKITNNRPWIFIGYSGSDPIFEHVKRLGRFDNGLFWVGYGNNSLSSSVQKFLTTPCTNAYYIKGYDADAFMLKLNELLSLPQPEILEKPFSSLKAMLCGINDINDEENFKGVKERLEISKKNIEKSIRQFEENKLVIVDENELVIDKLKKEIIGIIIAETYDKQQITTIEKKAMTINDASVNSQLSWLYLSWGNYIADLAKTKESKDVDDLFRQGFEKFQKAIEIKPDLYEVFNNWGSNLGNLARTKEGNVAEDFYRQTFEKFQKAIEIKPDLNEAFINWGICLGDLAKSKEGNEADNLYLQAFEKFQKAIEIKPDMHEAFHNWGTYLGDLAKTKEGKESDDLYRQAFEKFKKAIELKPDKHDAFINWGIYIVNLVKSKEGKEADDLYLQGFEKFEKAIEIKPVNHEAFYYWGILIGNHAKSKEGHEGEELYRQSLEKFQKAIEMKPDMHEAFLNWGNYLGNLAKTKEGKEADDIYRQAIEKYQKAIKFGGDHYNLACLHAIRGNKTEAMHHLNISLESKVISIDFVIKDCDWQGYLEDKQFKSLIDKFGNEIKKISQLIALKHTDTPTSW